MGLPPRTDPEDPLNPEDPNGGITTPPSGTTEPNEPSSGGDSHEGYGPAPKPPTPTPTPDPEPEPNPTTPAEPVEPGNTDPAPNGGGGLFDDLWGIAT